MLFVNICHLPSLYFPFFIYLESALKNTCFTQGFRVFTHKASKPMHLCQQTKIPQGTWANDSHHYASSTNINACSTLPYSVAHKRSFVLHRALFQKLKITEKIVQSIKIYFKVHDRKLHESFHTPYYSSTTGNPGSAPQLTIETKKEKTSVISFNWKAVILH